MSQENVDLVRSIHAAWEHYFDRENAFADLGLSEQDAHSS
jgi:hypothetical protein